MSFGPPALVTVAERWGQQVQGAGLLTRRPPALSCMLGRSLSVPCGPDVCYGPAVMRLEPSALQARAARSAPCAGVLRQCLGPLGHPRVAEEESGLRTVVAGGRGPKRPISCIYMASLPTRLVLLIICFPEGLFRSG